MAYVAVLIIVIGAGVLTAHAARRRGPPSVSLGATVVQAAALIAFIRLSLFWAGFALYRDYADWRQVAGYGVLVLNALLELVLTASLSGRHPGPPLMAAGLILVTSVGLGLAWRWLRFCPPFGGQA